MEDMLNTLNEINLTTFDIIIIGLVFALGLKGLINGFIKEVFAIFGLVGGIYIASRTSNDLSTIIEKNILQVENDSLLNLVSFLLILLVVWSTSSFMGKLFSKLNTESGLGVFNRVLGFIFSGGKYFVIFALIITALSNINAFKDKIDEVSKESTVYPLLRNSGEYLIDLENILPTPQTNQDNVENIK